MSIIAGQSLLVNTRVPWTKDARLMRVDSAALNRNHRRQTNFKVYRRQQFCNQLGDEKDDTDAEDMRTERTTCRS